MLRGQHSSIRRPPLLSFMSKILRATPGHTMFISALWFDSRSARRSLKLLFCFSPWATLPAHFSGYCFIFTSWCHDKPGLIGPLWAAGGHSTGSLRHRSPLWTAATTNSEMREKGGWIKRIWEWILNARIDEMRGVNVERNEAPVRSWREDRRTLQGHFSAAGTDLGDR